MKHKPVKVRWEDLEAAFNNRNGELEYYLDRLTGQVHLEGEDGEFEDDYEDDAVAAPATFNDQDMGRLYIEPLDDGKELAWVRAFLEGDGGIPAETASELARTLDGDDPLQAFRDALRDHEEVRERWFVFRSDRLHELMERWLADHGVQVTNPPPWAA